MELTDILLFEEKFNQALIYYSQIEMDLKNDGGSWSEFERPKPAISKNWFGHWNSLKNWNQYAIDC
jgi:hypothetical protein